MDWEAAIEALDGGVRVASAVVLGSSNVARGRCEDEITRQRLGLV
jgi:hypothetical protein